MTFAPDRRSFVVGAAAAAVLPWSVSRAQGASIMVPLELTENRVVLTGRIEGQGPLRFVLDTGGIVSLLRLDVATQLKLRRIGEQTLGMAGSRATYPMFSAHEVLLGGEARLADVSFAGTDVIKFGDDLSGSLAAGLLTGVDAELDFDRPSLTLYPAGGPARDGWTRGERAIEHKGLPNGSAFMFADVNLEGHRLRCGLDTGFPQAMRLTAETADRLKLADRNWAPAARRNRMVRAGSLTFGGADFNDTIVAFQTESRGPSDYGDGIIGLPLLRQLNIATDVKSSVIWTRRNSRPPQPSRYNLAGLWIERADDGAVIGEVGKGSPAEAAGLQRGDGVRGDFGSMLRSLAGPAGSKMSLSVVRGGAGRDVVITLADYL